MLVAKLFLEACILDTEFKCEEYFPLFPTINFLSRLGKDNFRSVLSENGLFVGQDEILFTIMFNSGAKPSEIAKCSNTSLASISVSLKRLEKAGFIEKRSDENDARISHIYLSEKGRQAMERIHKDLMSFEANMLKGFNEEEKLLLRRYLDRLIYNASGMENYSYTRPRKPERR